MSRVGKHKKGNVRMGFYVTPFRKAVAVLLADIADMTMTDVVWQGIETLAKTRGILDAEGKISRTYANQFKVVLETVKQSEVNS